MAGLSIALTVLGCILVLGTMVALAWLLRNISWEVLDDDQLDYGMPTQRVNAFAFARNWLKARPKMLTYRRDNRGRFRRHRR
jgi:hypothetical protein